MESQFWIHKVRLDGFHLKFHTKTHQAHTDLRFLGTNYKVILETCRLIGEQRLPQQDEAYKVSICVYGLSVRKRTNMMERNDELLYLLWLKICPQTSNIFRIARARFNGPFFFPFVLKKKGSRDRYCWRAVPSRRPFFSTTKSPGQNAGLWATLQPRPRRTN